MSDNGINKARRIRQGLILITAGVTIGLAGALALTRVLSGFLYGA